MRPCIFLGYDDDEFGYRVWDLVDKKVFRSQDIVFMEDKTIVDWVSVDVNQGRRYPLRERRAPQRFPDAKHVLLTDEGEHDNFEEVEKDTHRCNWLSAM